jgi:hypothetical protein
VSALDAIGTSGTVTVSKLNNQMFTGTFDVNVQATDQAGNPIGTPDHVTGSFDTTACAALSTIISLQVQTTCI